MRQTVTYGIALAIVALLVAPLAVAVGGRGSDAGTKDVVYPEHPSDVPPYDAQLTLSVMGPQTGSGIAGAEIYIWPDYIYGGELGVMGYPSYQETHGYTDGNGLFTTGTWNGAYTLSVYAEGYVYYYQSFQISGADVTLAVELEPIPEPDSTLTGRVVDQGNGLPIEGASIWVYTDYYSMGASYWAPYQPREAVYTNETGFYSVAAYGGSNSISVEADGYYAYWGTANVPQNFTMTFDVALFPIVEPETPSVIKGKVTDEMGAGIGGTTIQVSYWPANYYYMDASRAQNDAGIGYEETRPAAYQAGGDACLSCNYWQSWTYETTADPNGEYSLAVPTGELSVSAWASDYYPYYGWTSSYVDGNVWLNMTLTPVPEPDATIEGAVTDSSSGLPIEGAWVSAYLSRDVVEMYDYAVNEGLSYGYADSSVGAPSISTDALTYVDNYGYYCADTATDADGKYALQVPHGLIILDVWAPGYGYYSTTLDIVDGQVLTIDIALSQYSGDYYAAESYGNRSRQYVQPMSVTTNTLPVNGISSISLVPGESKQIYIDEVFVGGSGLNYSYATPSNVRVSYDEATGILSITAPEDWSGQEEITIKATDGTATITKTLSVSVTPPSMTMAYVGFVSAIALATAIIAAIWKAQRK
jgi:protocatechuate 3,4-dioxygenase beta subunit